MSSQWYGSLQNRIAEKSKMPAPVVGMGATELCYSDRHAYEIIEVKDDRHITVRRYDVRRVDHNGMCDLQSYVFTSNENNNTCELFRTINGEWRERYGARKLGSTRWAVGYASEYYDYSF